MVAFPLWVMGTRPLEGHVTLFLLTLLYWLSFSLRLSYAKIAARESEAFPMGLSLRLGLFFCLFAILFFLSPQLLVAFLLPLLFVGRFFLLVSVDLAQRVRQLAWIGAGFLLGMVVALGFYLALWQPTFLPFLEASPATHFFLSFWGRLQGLPAVLHSFEAMAAWTFFLLNAALFLGSFPRAFYKAFSPFIGQVSILAIWGFLFAGYPASFWDTMIEPDPIAAAGMVLLVINTALLVASWGCNWLDLHASYGRNQKSLYVMLLTALPASLCLIGALVVHAKDAACALANQALRETWPQMATLLPETAKPWLNPPKGAEATLLQRHAEGLPLTPILHPARQKETLTFNGKPWAQAAQEDPLLPALADLGDAPFMQYLATGPWAEGFFFGNPFKTAAEPIVAWAEALKTTAFAQTILGKRTVQAAYRAAARALADAALFMAPEDAAAALRTAKQYDPENVGLTLSLASLAASGVMITDDERNAAITIYNEAPYLEHPTLADLEAFEARYGTIRTPAFAAARRLAHFNAGALTDSCLQNLRHLYTTHPIALTVEERLYVLLHLTEAEALACLQRDQTALDPALQAQEDDRFFRELEGFLLFFITSPSARTLYEANRGRFSNPKTSYLSQLYRFDVDSSSFALQSEKIVSFYHRDKHIAYAYYYVRHLLQTHRLQTATDFLTSFDVQETLSKQPIFNQHLLLMLVEAWQAVDPAKAEALLAARLLSEVKQPLLWSRYLPLISDPALRQKSLATCLRLYPMLPVATQLFAETTATTHGPALAQRYLESVQQAQQQNIRMSPHAHR
jgi:hypothetical protein